jgi:hypothetical protein
VLLPVDMRQRLGNHEVNRMLLGFVIGILRMVVLGFQVSPSLSITLDIGKDVICSHLLVDVPIGTLSGKRLNGYRTGQIKSAADNDSG